MHVLIIGAGPAGVSAALYARRGGADVTVIAKEVGALGTAETIENYYGIEEPVSGRELARRGIEGARRLGVTFVTNEVLGITGDGTSFAVEGKSELYTGDAVVLATGATRKTLSIPGIREFTGRGVSSCAVCDAFFYRGKTTSVIGAGEYALHEVQDLLPHAAQVQLLTNGGEPPAGVPPEVTVYTERIARIEGDRRVARVVFADGTAADTAGVFLAIGTAGTAELARKLGVLVEDGKIVVNAQMETNVPGVYAAGDCTGGLLQIVKAAYEGAQAGLSTVRCMHKKK